MSQIWLISDWFGPTHVAKSWLIAVRRWSKPTQVWLSLPKFGQIWPTAGEFESKFGRTQHDVAKSVHNFGADVGPTCVADVEPDVRENSDPNLVPDPDLAEFGQGQLRPDVGRRPPKDMLLPHVLRLFIGMVTAHIMTRTHNAPP